jgi:hypothetical protein
MDLDDERTTLCPGCGAKNRTDASFCFLCRQLLPRPVDDTVPPLEVARLGKSTSFAQSHQARARTTFSLSAIILVIALIAVWLGVLRESRGLGVALAVLAAPALGRTLTAVDTAAARGQSMTATQKVLRFMLSWATVVAVAGVIVVAFAIAGAAICLMAIGVAAGGLR